MKRRDVIKGGAIGATAAATLTLAGCGQQDKAEIERLKAELEKAKAATEEANKKAMEAAAVAKERVEIAMVTTWPRDFPGLGTGAQRLAQRLSDMRDGRIQVEYFAAGERVDCFHALRVGVGVGFRIDIEERIPGRKLLHALFQKRRPISANAIRLVGAAGETEDRALAASCDMGENESGCPVDGSGDTDVGTDGLQRSDDLAQNRRGLEDPVG